MAEILDQVLGWLRGTPPPTPDLGLAKAPPMTSYPSNYDADYARNYGFGDNNEHEEYLNNQKIRVLGSTPTSKGTKRATQAFKMENGTGHSTEDLTDPKYSEVINLNNTPSINGVSNNLMMRAALAVNRSPIAAVGFDPSKVITNPLLDRRMTNLGGQFDPATDYMYSTVWPDDSIVHESTHRGIQKLFDAHPDQTKEILSRLPGSGAPDDTETIVRWLMKTKAANKEEESIKSYRPDYVHPQIEHAKKMFDNPGFVSSELYRKALNDLEELAIQHMKGRGKRAGPQ